MTLELSFVACENEYFTHHYLHTVFETDLAERFERWAEQEKQGLPLPHHVLQELPRAWFAARQRMHCKDGRERQAALHNLFAPSLTALGYPLEPIEKPGFHDQVLLPLWGEVRAADGTPRVWLLAVDELPADAFDPLEAELQAWQFRENQVPSGVVGRTLAELVTHDLFALPEPPRFVLVLSFSQLLLIDRAKWNERRLLRFDLEKLCELRAAQPFKTFAALLCRESLAPDEGGSLLDTLDEQSHRHAFAVSEDLKYAVRKAVELLGNEAIWYTTARLHKPIYSHAIDPEQLSRECLRYLYRLLFLFYVEARPELGYAPMNSPTYLEGYSLEALRELELLPLTGEEAENGYYFHASVARLFDLVYKGYNHEGGGVQDDLLLVLLRAKQDEKQRKASERLVFTMAPLQSSLFDPARTPILRSVRLRNRVWQQVLELLSLSRPQRGGRGGFKRRGRISYAQLGINQLGAVYEGLLSYQGFFAETALFEVKKPDEEGTDELARAFFVPEANLGDYKPEELVYDDEGRPVRHERGSFIYRLAGRGREQSASYYTPEVLTRCLVKYALKELLEGKTADAILGLTVCEPALGSGAFLNEAINQLAEAYLQRKQHETGTVLPPEQYGEALQRVKALLASHNVFGVDLNPVAIELAEISLWLNSIAPGTPVPWFRMQLAAGNSLIGARRQVFPGSALTCKKGSWCEQVPTRLQPGAKRPTEAVYHFLLADPGMADYPDKAVKSLAPQQLKTLAAKVKDLCTPHSSAEVRRLLELSEAVDGLWQRCLGQQRTLWRETRDELACFGRTAGKAFLPLASKDQRYDTTLLSRGDRNAGPYRRLKLCMDYWCSLWFWPIERADLFPSRDEWLLDLAVVLEGGQYRGRENFVVPGQQNLFAKPGQEELLEAAERHAGYGVVELDELTQELPRFAVIDEVARRQRFFHWELHFAHLFEDRGGFDLVLGNPPWIKVEWEEGGVLGDHDPRLVLRGYSAPQVAELRAEALVEPEQRSEYYAAYESAVATKAYLNGLQNYPLLQGMQTNLYKCFLPLGWSLGTKQGVLGLLHPEGVYDDPKGGELRAAMYPRLRYHFQFENELKNLLFPEVDNHTKYSINIFSTDSSKSTISFHTLGNLFYPTTIDTCFSSHSSEPVYGIKNDNGDWNLRGHPLRVIPVKQTELVLFSTLFDEQGTPYNQARLPVVHSQEILQVLKKFAAQPRRLGDLRGEYFSLEMWHETNAQKDHTIRRETRFPQAPSEWILSGPHFHVGNPLHQTPMAVCETNRAYDKLDLTFLPDDYLPRTNYVPDCPPEEYARRTPRVPWGEKKKVTEYYRLAARGMLSQSGERTLICSIVPPETGHINGIQTTAFSSINILLNAASMLTSLVSDFYVKSTGKSNLHFIWLSLPYLECRNDIVSRSIILTSVSSQYAQLWHDCWQSDFHLNSWTKQAPQLDPDFFKKLTPQWQRHCALRTDYERRQALVEIDVLVAQALGLTLQELCTIYRVQFPVLRMYENDTFYDQQGRIVFTASKGLPGVGFDRKQWDDLKTMTTGTVERTIIDTTLPTGPVERTLIYHAPFDKCDREEDYTVAWEEFERRGRCQ